MAASRGSISKANYNGRRRQLEEPGVEVIISGLAVLDHGLMVLVAALPARRRADGLHGEFDRDRAGLFEHQRALHRLSLSSAAA